MEQGMDEEKWPEPQLKNMKDICQESMPQKENLYYVKENEPDEWDALLDRNPYWRTLRITARILRFKDNCLAKKRGSAKKKGPIDTSEIEVAKNYWIRRVKNEIPDNLETTGWQLIKDEDTGILKCKGRIVGYQPTYLNEGLFVEKLIAYTHEKIMHLGVASTMAAIREDWWVTHLRSKVKKTIKTCNICKIFSTKPYGAPTTSALPDFRTNPGRPFEVTGVDFAGPLICKVGKKETEKCYVTCATSRAVHLELTHTQSAEEFQEKLNAFITRKTRPRRMISDNASVFKATAAWIKKVRKKERTVTELFGDA